MTAREQVIEKMRREALSEQAIETFVRQYDRLCSGEQGTIAEAQIEPVERLDDAEALTDAQTGLDQLVVIKLNGGLGTSMGLDRAKSLLEVKQGHSFLDLICEQVLVARERTGARLPLVLMNSFATRADSLAALGRHPGIESDRLAPDFLQGRVPKLIAADELHPPVSHPSDPALEWVPPGHGDLYPALAGSGMLATLLERGFRYAFVSNSDNLGATLEPRILAWMIERGAPLVMEACDRTPSDRKGGHLARRKDGGGLILREVAQTPPDDLAAFQDTGLHRYFNTNSLWIDLQALQHLLAERGVIELPMIVNRKTVDPRDPASTPVIQLETAMGSAIGLLDGAAAIRVPRSRYAPVKTTADLLALRSDAYLLGDDRAVRLAPERAGTPPLIELDDEYFRRADELERRFPSGAPSLVGCDRLRVRGDVTFGAGFVIEGEVTVYGPQVVAGGSLLRG